jgi:formylglycine-generating enzyme required for sulfatase activity
VTPTGSRLGVLLTGSRLGVLATGLLALLQASCAQILLDDPKFDRHVVLVETDGGSFYIDATEVTVGQYADWLATNPAPKQPEACAFNTSFDPGHFTGDTMTDICPSAFNWKQEQQNPDHPVSCVDWCDANAYCEAQGERLCGRVGGGTVETTYDSAADRFYVVEPSTSEWYLACSRGGAREYPYGNTYDASACNGTSGLLEDVGTSPQCVGGYDGLFDMSGNVAEWEDSCMAGAADAACIPRGGAFYNAQPGYDPTQLACPYKFSAVVRSSQAQSTGFRCCADR